MTEQEFADIGNRLQVAVPEEYRSLILARGAELKALGCFDDAAFSMFYIAPGQVLSANLSERDADSGTASAFPEWWKTFFLVGTNGGGDYYCLRLDDRPGVWMIGSDCGDEPTPVAETLQEFVDGRVGEHRERLREEAERRERLGEDGAAQLRAAEESGDERAKEWVDYGGPYPMFQALDGLDHPVSVRKLRLYGIAACRQFGSPAYRPAVWLAQRMVLGAADAEEVRRMREGLMQYAAPWYLLHDDPELLRQVWNGLNNVAGGTLHTPLADLLREVLGNPFLPVQFEPQWRTPEVVETARAIYEGEDFDRMPQLADALAAAGCTEPRMLKHCTRRGGHVRGCWLLDLVLDLEPPPQEIAWDFTCEHPPVDPARLKERLERFGADAPGDAKRLDAPAALEFADRLDAEGAAGWAAYIRNRCAFNGKPFGADYPDLLEQAKECAAGLQLGDLDLQDFYFSGYRLAEDEWWDAWGDDTEFGLPARVLAVRPGGGPLSLRRLQAGLDGLIRRTPIRGVDFEEHYGEHMAEILAAPVARHFRELRSENPPGDGPVSPFVAALVRSPVVETLEELHLGALPEGDALALADAPFRRLRRLDVAPYGGITCPAEALTRLMTAPWFRNLEQVRMEFPEETGRTGLLHLAGMPKLHSLALQASNPLIRACAEAGPFPALRRLCVYSADLTGGNAEAFARLGAPHLLDLRLDGNDPGQVPAADFARLAASPLFAKLLVLGLGLPKINEQCLRSLAGSGCASRLRILRLDCGEGNFQSLSKTPLTPPGAFPALTTLEIRYPYAKSAKRDSAAFLAGLTTPNLRHLNLADCDFDDECAAILAGNLTFARLTRLHLNQGYGAIRLLTSEARQPIQVAGDARPVVVGHGGGLQTPRQHCRPGGHTLGADVGLVKTDARLGQPIDVRCTGKVVAPGIATYRSEALVIGENIQDIGRPLLGRSHGNQVGEGHRHRQVRREVHRIDLRRDSANRERFPCSIFLT